MEWSEILGSDYMSRAGPISQATLVCQDDFKPVLHEVSQPGWWLMRWTAGDQCELDFAYLQRCTLTGLMSQAGLANGMTRKTPSPVSWDPS